MQAEVPDAAAFAKLTRASDAQMALLERYVALLTDWSGRFNLLGPSALADFWGRHAYDSWQVVQVEPAALRWADLGSGAGLPGVVVAVMLKDREGAQVHLVDSLMKRCRFLAEVVTTLDLPAEVHHARAEDFSRRVDVVTARACAPLERLLTYARPWMDAGARGLFLKGAGADAEITAARRKWRFTAETLPSLSDPEARLIRVEGLTHHGG